METTVDKFGRVVIPKKIRNEHGMAPRILCGPRGPGAVFSGLRLKAQSP